MEGTVFNLPGRLEELLCHHGSMLPKGADEEIPLIKQDLEEIISILHGHSEPKLEDHGMVVRCWMKEVRELSYDIEDSIDQYKHAARSQNRPNIRHRKFNRWRGNKIPCIPQKLKQRLWMANKIREFSLRAQEALQRHAMYNNLGGVASTASTTRGDVCSATPLHPTQTQFREHVDNVRSVSIEADGMEAALNDLNKLKNLLAGIPTASLVQFREHADKVRGIHTDIEAILNKLENIPPGITITTTTRGDVSSTSSRQPTRFMESTCHVGIDAAMDQLENLIDVCGEEKLKVVSIVGVGGVGKTTLANKLYHKLRWQFECWAFVRSSQKTDMRRLLINILSQVRPHQSPDNWKVHSLISSIRTYLQDKRFLIVIDDLWATSTWDIIKCALPEGNKSSRILTTTEIEDLALQSCSYDLKFIFKMIPFGEDDSRKLLFSIVFGSHSKCPPEVSETLYDIVRKCGGLPLAIVTVASLLASQLDKLEQWDYINKSLGYSLMANPTLEGMKQLLNLCYSNLPQHLKACMLYLSMYQGDHIIWKDDLVNQWIAEGFICATEEHDKEEISRGYFDELVGRKIIQPVHIDDSGEVLSCVVHHIVLNFVTYKSIEENFIIAIDHSQATIRFADKVRRLSIHFSNVEDAPPPTNMRLFQVRTIAFFGVLKYMPFIMEFRLIKVLFLHFLGDEDSTGIVDLTKISELVRLRYLKVTSNATVKLPTRLQGLQYLETLKIDGKISEVPSDIIHLPGLLHLTLPAKTNLPTGISHVTSLRTIGYFDLSCNSVENLWRLGELTNLWDLQLTYSEIHSDNLKNNMKYLGPILGKLRNLKSITLSADGSSCPDTLRIDRDTKTRIYVDGWSSVSSPPALLQRFELLPCVCIFSNLPNWIGQLGNLCILKIGIREVTSNNIDVLGVLPELIVLSLYVHTKPAERIVFDNAGFSILRYFKFICSVAWMKFEVGAMPSLRKLKLGFDVHRADQHDIIPVGIEHLSGLEEISAKIRVACSAHDHCKRFAESALSNAFMMHPGRPSVNIRCVDWTFDGKDDDNVRTQEEEHRTLQKQHHTAKEGSNEKSPVKQRDPREGAHKSVDGRETLRRIRVKVSSTVDDGFSWVKYGQKDILGTMYPRSYFRCIHRQTKGCLATKQVQPTDDDHQILDVIYYGEHTCDQSARSDDRQPKSSRPAASSNLQEPQQPGLEQSRPAAKRRRKTVRWKTQVRVSSVQDVGPLDDGYSWRKYGLKDILGAKYPRSYFRCTHRNTQGCVATKQIQRRDGDPLLFDVVYHGDHTCSERASLNEQVTWPRSSASSTEQSSTITYTAAAGSVEDDEEGVTSATNFLSMDDMLDLGGGDVIDMDFPSFDFDAIDALLLG
uniref:WRKY domain-containing protein n=1 Tax=Oryza nivara TaxID=4536 RepID=A0A0E0GG08_ORYNI